MKFFFKLILILAFAYIAARFLDWWAQAIAAFLIGLLLSEKRKRRMFGRRQPPSLSFLAGFLAFFLLWGGMAFWLDLQNDSLLSRHMAALILQTPNAETAGPIQMVLISALIGGLLGGFSTMTGNLLGIAIKS